MRKIIIFFVVVFLTSCIGRDRLVASPEALWSNHKQADKWTQWTKNAILDSTLLQQIPRDISQFCPKYNHLDNITQTKFWVVLLSAMTKYESNFNPQAQYTEKFKDQSGKLIVSRGLLQISKESANQKRYDCQINDEKDLHNAKTNLTCGIKILSYWVKSDGVIASVNGKNKGGARYWSVLRSTNGILKKIKTHTQTLKFCF